jgi:L-fuculose-phosphate aldolase
MTEHDLRRTMADTMKELASRGLNQGSEGNVGVRCGDELLVTPSGIAATNIMPGDMVAMKMDGTWSAASGRKPSSEWRIHRDILATRADVAAVVHTHSIAATALATLRRDIPAFHYMVAMAGGDSIRCASYETFGTEALSKAVLAALHQRNACLIANHGMIALGTDLAAALRLAIEVERLAEIYRRALEVGEPALLPRDEMERVLAKFRSGAGYGSEPARGAAESD